jgi:2-polyprenyl-3-methyl-5-hydroxy-6-metoxy-1,4-benzoquinol methylase
VLLPERLAALWNDVQCGRTTDHAATQAQEQLIAEYVDVWKDALLLEGHKTLESSILAELAEYTGAPDVEHVRRRCCNTDGQIAAAWRQTVNERDRASVDAFYDTCEVDLYIHSLMWWHTLADDNSPLAYVLALQFGRERGCRSFLDFGAGAGSGAVLYAKNGMTTAAADISAPMLAFTAWRLRRRGLAANVIDLRSAQLPAETYDMITAMDVFEHLSDPLGTVDTLARALEPGGYLFGRFAVEKEDDHPLHIVRDFAPVFDRLAQRGLEKVWSDNWLWGHTAFQKR